MMKEYVQWRVQVSNWVHKIEIAIKKGKLLKRKIKLLNGGSYTQIAFKIIFMSNKTYNFSNPWQLILTTLIVARICFINLI